MSSSSPSLLILGCSRRKRKTSRLIPAIERYDGPLFRVLRKHAVENPDARNRTFILSGKFGLINANFLIPRYDRRLSSADANALRETIEKQLKKTINQIQPETVFVSVGSQYWQLLEKPLSREIPANNLLVATGSMGGRASQLAYWLRPNESAHVTAMSSKPIGEASLLGTRIRLTRDELLRKAKESIAADPEGSLRFQTWFVEIGEKRVAPKWLVSILFDKPVARFRTADARQILSSLGVECIYANHH